MWKKLKLIFNKVTGSKLLINIFDKFYSYRIKKGWLLIYVVKSQWCKVYELKGNYGDKNLRNKVTFVTSNLRIFEGFFLELVAVILLGEVTNITSNSYRIQATTLSEKVLPK